MRRTLGATVFSGMVGVTIFGIFLTPVFFSVIDWLGEARVFRLPVFRWFNTIVLGTLSLRPVRQFVRNLPVKGKPAPLSELEPGLDLEPPSDGEFDAEPAPALSSTPAVPVPASSGEPLKQN
jgi:hypothetical protein